MAVTRNSNRRNTSSTSSTSSTTRVTKTRKPARKTKANPRVTAIENNISASHAASTSENTPNSTTSEENFSTNGAQQAALSAQNENFSNSTETDHETNGSNQNRTFFPPPGLPQPNSAPLFPPGLSAPSSLPPGLSNNTQLGTNSTNSNANAATNVLNSMDPQTLAQLLQLLQAVQQPLQQQNHVSDQVQFNDIMMSFEQTTINNMKIMFNLPAFEEFKLKDDKVNDSPINIITTLKDKCFKQIPNGFSQAWYYCLVNKLPTSDSEWLNLPNPFYTPLDINTITKLYPAAYEIINKHLITTLSSTLNFQYLYNKLGRDTHPSKAQEYLDLVATVHVPNVIHPIYNSAVKLTNNFEIPNDFLSFLKSREKSIEEFKTKHQNNLVAALETVITLMLFNQERKFFPESDKFILKFIKSIFHEKGEITYGLLLEKFLHEGKENVLNVNRNNDMVKINTVQVDFETPVSYDKNQNKSRQWTSSKFSDQKPASSTTKPFTNPKFANLIRTEGPEGGNYFKYYHSIPSDIGHSSIGDKAPYCHHCGIRHEINQHVFDLTGKVSSLEKFQQQLTQLLKYKPQGHQETIAKTLKLINENK